jgi:hypothetical protein
VRFYDGGNLVRPVVLEVPYNEVVRITQTGKLQDLTARLRLDIKDQKTNKQLLNGSLQTITGDKDNENFAYSGFAQICFPEFQGFVLAFQRGATGMATLFVIFRSTPESVVVAKTISATSARVAIDNNSHTLTLYDMFDDPNEAGNIQFGCDFCMKHYKLTTYAVQDSKLVRVSRSLSKMRFSPQDFVDHPLILK